MERTQGGKSWLGKGAERVDSSGHRGCRCTRLGHKVMEVERNRVLEAGGAEDLGERGRVQRLGDWRAVEV